MNLYEEQMAPLFTKLLRQREFVQHEILRQINERLKSKTVPRILSSQEFERFERSALELKDLWNARRRINDGSYGRCADCKDAIELQRLQARLTTEYCSACQDHHDQPTQTETASAHSA